MKTTEDTHVPLTGFPHYPEAGMQARARAFHDSMATRRSVRAFSDQPVPREIIKACVATAGSAPSGANHQPWFFACVNSAEKKRRSANSIQGAPAKTGSTRSPRSAPMPTSPIWRPRPG